VQPGWVEAFESLALSPDGSRLAVVYARGGRSDLWVKRLDQADAPPQRLTFQEWEILRPAWLPGGDTVLVVAAREVGRRAEILAKKWDGTGEVWAAVDSTAPGAGKGFQGISVASDGSWIVYRAGGGTATRDIFGLETATGEVVPLVAESFNEHSPALSPDVRWLAYVSNESGREEVYVRPFPEVNGGKWLVSTEGGAEPAWSPDARELYYRDSRGMLVAARLGEGNSFSVAGRRSLFSVEGFVWDPVHAQYAVHPDGERFLMLRLLEDGTSRVAWIEDFASGLVAAGDAGR
jgi:Tol biopolymer transport system component